MLPTYKQYYIMRIRSGLSMRCIADEYIMITDNGKELDYTKAVSLNETAAYLIQTVGEKDFEAEDLAKHLIERYDVDFDQALRDVDVLLVALREAGILQD